MTTWNEFYNQIRDPSWPDCALEEDFYNLPLEIQTECRETFGYQPGSFKKTSRLPHKVFPIKTATSCQLKWNWSTVYLTTEETASCHRTDQHRFDTSVFDFHNTPRKLNDRSRMLKDQWPEHGCNYCRDIESAGGQSDRMTNLDLIGMHAPYELDQDPAAINVTPRILEVYFDNTCNLKCVYCGPKFSSLWAAEIKKYGTFEQDGLKISPFAKSNNIEQNKQKLFQWLKDNGRHLTNFNFLGGEPLYQKELEECLDVFEQNPAPHLKLQIFSNLNAKLPYLKKIVQRIKSLVETDHLREFEITASLDCWGDPQEYARFPLDLKVWEENFEYVLSQPWINLIIGSTITPLTIKTLPDLLAKVNEWRKVRQIYHYQNSVESPSYMYIDIFGDIFSQDFEAALALKPATTPEEIASLEYLRGIAKESGSKPPNVPEITKLFRLLNELDARRGTNWKTTFPWLIDEFAKYDLKI